MKVWTERRLMSKGGYVAMVRHEVATLRIAWLNCKDF